MKHTDILCSSFKKSGPQDWNKQANQKEMRKKEKELAVPPSIDLEKISRRSGVIVSAHSLGHPDLLENYLQNEI